MNDRIVFWLLLYTVLINTLLLAYLAWRTWRDHRPQPQIEYRFEGPQMSKEQARQLVIEATKRSLFRRPSA